MGHLIEYIVFKFAGFLFGIFPLKTVQFLGARAGEFVGMTLGYRRAVTMDNLQNAFPDRSVKELESIMRGSFRSVGTALFEFVCLQHMTREEVTQAIQIDNPEFVNEVVGRNKGIIMLTAHFGNWEFLAQSIPAQMGIPVHVIVKPQSNRWVDKSISVWRTKFGNVLVPMESSVRELLKALRENKAIGIVADQTAAKESASIPFFGREVPTFEGPAMFSLKTGAPAIIGFAVRQEDGRYKAHFQEVPANDLKEYTKENVIELTKRHVAMLESAIRKYPEQWLWMHKRWKHVPSRVSSTTASGIA